MIEFEKRNILLNRVEGGIVNVGDIFLNGI